MNDKPILTPGQAVSDLRNDLLAFADKLNRYNKLYGMRINFNLGQAPYALVQFEVIKTIDPE